jgi:uncharacterized repeat protein (TIGR01451 family)
MQVCLLLIPVMLLIGTAFFSPEENQATSSTDMKWLRTTPLPKDLVSHCAVVYSDTLYIVGGGVYSEDIYSRAVYSAKIKASGDIREWVTRPLTEADSLFTAPVKGAAAVVSEEGWIYVIGGYQNRAASGITHYSRINPDTGSVGIWKTVTPTLQARWYAAAVRYGNSIYVLGGRNESSALGTVYHTSINEDGTIQEWATTTPLLTPVAGLSAVEYGGRIYVSGGSTGNPSMPCIGTIYSATIIMPSGELSNWEAISTLPAPNDDCLRYHMSVVSGGQLYLIGGMNENWTRNNNVYRAPFNPDGTLGDWEVLNSTQTALSDHAVVVDTKGRIYVLGGAQCDSCSQRTVYYIPLISFSKSSNPLGEVKCADLITYTIHYAANMPGITLTNVVITDLVPSNVMLDRSSISDGGCERDGVIIWDNLEDFSIESGEHTVFFRVKVSETECGYDDPQTSAETSTSMAIPTTAYAPMCPKPTPTCTCTDPIAITNRAWISSDQESRKATLVNSPLGIYLPIILKSGD